jgi:hypothetical protein
MPTSSERYQIPGSVSDSPNYAEKRSGQDRRSHKLPKLKYLFFSGRRERARRKDDWYKTFYFDRYSQKLFAAIVVILLLSVLDALLTLYLIDNGSSELNPVMSYSLKFGPFAFMGVKYFLTCIGVVTLLIFKDVIIKKPQIHAHYIFSYLIGIFSTVIAWELYLIIFVVS